MRQTLVARHGLLRRVWTTLEFDSVMLSGPRRIGKTSLLRYMEAYPEPLFEVVYTSVEGFNLGEAGRAIARNLVESRRAVFSIRSSFRSLSSFAREPDVIEVVESALQNLDKEKRLVLMIDEFTWLLSQSEEPVGRNIFDVLRHLRMRHPRLRMVFAGESVEHLGHKYADLGFFNDLSVVAIPNLSVSESNQLVSQLADYEGVNLEINLRRKIAEIGDGNPYYIKALTQRIMRNDDFGQSEKETHKALNKEAKFFRDQFLADLIEETLWRIDRTYDEKIVRAIHRILDALASGSRSRIPVFEIVDAANGPTREALRVLELAGILDRTEDDYVLFRHALIRQWWRENRHSGARADGDARLEEAVASYRFDLRDNTRDKAPLAWANTQVNLGSALMRLGERESSTMHLEEAIVAFRNALEVNTRERVPLDWANTQMNLGSALMRLGERESSAMHLEEAIVAFRNALEVNTRDKAPLAWANTQMNLGSALMRLGERESSTMHLEEAIVAFRNALEVNTRERVPLDWANTHVNLSMAKLVVAQKNHEQSMFNEAIRHLEAAISLFQEAEYEPGITKAGNLVEKARALRAEISGSDTS